MRCDYPMGYDEDYLEPACEIFLQLFLQNAQIAANEELNQDNEGVVNVDADFEVGYESDDNFSFPSLHTISDVSLSTEELSGDEDDIIVGTISEESINPEDFDGNSTIDLSYSPEIDSAEGYQFLDDGILVLPENRQSSSAEGHQFIDHGTVVLPENRQSSSAEGHQFLDDGILVLPENCQSSSAEGHQFLDHGTVVLPENRQSSSAEGHQFLDHGILVLPENRQSSRSSSTINSEDSDTITNVACQETDDCADISASNLCPSNETSFFEESTVQINSPPSNNTASSPSNNINSTPSTFVSLYVVVPPTSFSHESDSLLSEVSSDRLFSDNIPVNFPSSSLAVSDNGNIASQDESLHTVNKICDNSEESIPDSSAVCDSFSLTENKKHMPELDSTLDSDNTISPENTVGFDENSHSEFVAYDAHLSEEAKVLQDENISRDVISDKSMQNLKRKVNSVVDDDKVNKVPKYSLSHESSESINEVSLNNYSKELSNDSEMSLLCDEGKIDIVPSTVSVENVILPLGKIVDENSVTERRKDL